MAQLCPYASTGMKFTDEQVKECPVLQHARFFSDKNYNLTSQSITDGHKIQGITSGVNIKQKAILNLLHDHNMNPTADNLATMVNPAATGLWGTDMKFNEKRFESLCELAIKMPVSGKRIITKEIFNNFREKMVTETNPGTATYIYYFIPVPWKKVTDGSINELFQYYNDCWVLQKNKLEPALTIEHIKLFYTEPNKVMQMKIDGILPASTSVIYELE